MEENELLSVIYEYRSLVHQYQEKYGTHSLIVHALKLTFLSRILKYYPNQSEKFNKEFLNDLSSVRKLVKMMPVPHGNWEPMSVDSSTNLIHFDTDYYNRVYLPILDKYQDGILKLTAQTLHDCEPAKWYLYVMGPQGDILIFNQGFTPLEVFKDRSELPKHAILAEDFDLSVVCAGEIFWTFDSNQNNVKFIINNKSGHFKPDYDHLHWCSRLLCRTFNISDEKVIQIDYSY
ncbi:hypothetical protein [Lactiplantibacillus pentosus]|uniref:hypothetical protein n=1 Tax=Lactiplantibacillus pentosus TaxID=1589 RepID=UPI00259AF05B|nr:hypothetical protein [Lactiplantibacillus pentosus]WFC03545.1 hypothetical protein PGN10_00925 [Lactiplantibacillus pentosus]